MSKSRPRNPAALVQPLTPPVAAPPVQPAPPPPQGPPAPKTDAEAVAQCLALLKRHRVTLKDGSAVTRATLPTVVTDIIGLLLQSDSVVRQLRTTLKSVL